MEVGLQLTALEIIQFVIFNAAVIAFYFRGMRKLEGVKFDAARLDQFRTIITSEIGSLKASMVDQLALMNSHIETYDRRIESLDDRYVRKDVFSAHIMLLDEKLKSLRVIEQILIETPAIQSHKRIQSIKSKRGKKP